VNTFLAVKATFHENPVTFILTCIICGTLISAYSTYIFEREAQPENWNFGISIFVALTCMLTGWATDVYDTYNPVTWASKGICIATVVFGIFLLALLIDYIHQKMHPSLFQLTALDWILSLKLEETERQEAAKLIQITYRQYKWGKLQEATGKSEDQSPYSIEFLKQKNVLRRIRKQKKKQGLSSRIEDVSREAEHLDFHTIFDELKKSIVSEITQVLEIHKQQILQSISTSNHSISTSATVGSSEKTKAELLESDM